MCCRGCGIFLILVVLVFTLVESVASKWIVFAAAILLLFYEASNHCSCSTGMASKPKGKAKRKKRG